MEKGIIYCLRSPSEKEYIGQTGRELDTRLLEHETREECWAIHNAIKKYGIENFKVEVLYEGPYDEEKLDEMEINFIKDRNTLSPNGYNIRTGGKAGKHCEASREKMRLSKLGDKNHNYGKPRTPETKEKISLSRIGEKHHFYGKELSLEHRLNLSKAHKREEDKDLPMCISRVSARPEHYCGAGYAVSNHPTLKKRQFVSTKLSDSEKLKLAMDYLNSANQS